MVSGPDQMILKVAVNDIFYSSYLSPTTLKAFFRSGFADIRRELFLHNERKVASVPCSLIQNIGSVSNSDDLYRGVRNCSLSRGICKQANKH